MTPEQHRQRIRQIEFAMEMALDTMTEQWFWYRPGTSEQSDYFSSEADARRAYAEAVS